MRRILKGLGQRLTKHVIPSYARYIIYPLFFAFVYVKIEAFQGVKENNGFQFSHLLVPKGQIQQGGPGKDGIPALNNPDFLAATKARFMDADDKVLGLSIKGEIKAYPIKILNWHEIVNDTLGGQNILVSFCPLCGSGMVFYGNDGTGERRTFGVSGLLYNSDVLMYDHETESLWSQLKMQAISGEESGHSLHQIPVSLTTWERWIKRHPNTKVLDINTGYHRDYGRDPYASYRSNNGLYFPVKYKDERYNEKEWVVGIKLNRKTKAYPFIELSKQTSPVKDTLAGVPITINFDMKSRTAEVTDEKGKRLTSTTLYWFAWYAFHPNTDIYQYHN